MIGGHHLFGFDPVLARLIIGDRQRELFSFGLGELFNYVANDYRERVFAEPEEVT